MSDQDFNVWQKVFCMKSAYLRANDQILQIIINNIQFFRQTTTLDPKYIIYKSLWYGTEIISPSAVTAGYVEACADRAVAGPVAVRPVPVVDPG